MEVILEIAAPFTCVLDMWLVFRYRWTCLLLSIVDTPFSSR